MSPLFITRVFIVPHTFYRIRFFKTFYLSIILKRNKIPTYCIFTYCIFTYRIFAHRFILFCLAKCIIHDNSILKIRQSASSFLHFFSLYCSLLHKSSDKGCWLVRINAPQHTRNSRDMCCCNASSSYSHNSSIETCCIYLFSRCYQFHTIRIKYR